MKVRVFVALLCGMLAALVMAGRRPKDLRSVTRGGMSDEVRGVTNSIRLVREL